MTYQAPKYRAASFTCPHCEAITAHQWTNALRPAPGTQGVEWAICQSHECKGFTLWVGRFNPAGGGQPLLDRAVLVYPAVKPGPLANEDMPEPVRKDYEEARTVMSLSPRAAAALLRLGLQRLMPLLGTNGKDLNDDIAQLVARGMPDRYHQAADVLRVTGNDAVHPGQIDTDDEETVGKLFSLLNLIVQSEITAPNEVTQLFDELPESKREHIARRNVKAAGGNGEAK